jgi:hypothetical protein
MRRVAVLLAAVFGLASNAAGGDIDGKIVGWSRPVASPQHLAVVWLDGAQTKPIDRNGPVMAQHGGSLCLLS